MLGGGVFVTQNKVLPGTYINIVSATKATSNLGERGIVAIALPLGYEVGTIIELTAEQFVTAPEDYIGNQSDNTNPLVLREIFKHANKCLIYDMGEENTVDEFLSALDGYEFNVVCAYTGVVEDVTKYISKVKYWRDELGKKCQVVVYNQTTPDYEGVINVVSTVAIADDDEVTPVYALLPWVAGAEAGCAINGSCTNMVYDGEYTIVLDKNQTALEACIKAGQFVFHNVYGQPRVLEDLNSLTTTTADKGDDFKYNQTIRVIDQIANDIAKLFNIKYLGKIQNNDSGRVSLWADIVAHHKELETMGAIENFDSGLVVVEQGATKKQVVVSDVVTIVNAMAQVYMTVVIQ